MFFYAGFRLTLINTKSTWTGDRIWLSQGFSILIAHMPLFLNRNFIGVGVTIFYLYTIHETSFDSSKCSLISHV